MLTSLNTLITWLTPMTSDSSQDWYVSEFYTGEPSQAWAKHVPFCAVIPQPSSVEAAFVEQDTDTENFNIRFYQSGARSNMEPAEVQAGITKLMAQSDYAKTLLRTDPTNGGAWVTSSIKINPTLPVTNESNAYRMGEIQIEIKTRRLWGQ